jgi:hypothetical protein
MSLLYPCEKCSTCSIKTCMAIRIPSNNVSTTLNSNDGHKQGLMGGHDPGNSLAHRSALPLCAGWHHPQCGCQVLACHPANGWTTKSFQFGTKAQLGAWACSPIPAFKQQEQRALPTSPHRSSTTRKTWLRRRLPTAAPEAIAVRTASSIFPRQWRLTKLFMAPPFFIPPPSVPSDRCLLQYCKCVCCISRYATGCMSRRSLAALLVHEDRPLYMVYRYLQRTLTACSSCLNPVEHFQGIHLGIQGPLLPCRSGFGGDWCLV